MDPMRWRGFAPYVSVARRRANASREIARLEKKGRELAPIHIDGRAIADTFWGQAWCDNIETYSDFSNRLPRGRTYVRNGSVIDLQLSAGRIDALVNGSQLYNVKIDVQPLKPAKWKSIKHQCAGQIGSLIELLQGKLSDEVMKIITLEFGGLAAFVEPAG
jgi:uncharacterized Zn finger protein